MDSFSQEHKAQLLCDQHSALVGTGSFSAWCATVCYTDVDLCKDLFSFSHVTVHLLQGFVDICINLSATVNVLNNAMSILNPNCDLKYPKKRRQIS